MNRYQPTENEAEEFKEKLYKMYDAKDRADYEGSIAKYECTINKELGIFKERHSLQSKDHIMEQFAYEIAEVLGVPCCKDSCRKVNGVYGSFSRYEVPDLNNVIAFKSICGYKDLFSNDLFNFCIDKVGRTNQFVIRIYQYVIFDFILGQLDRHMENLAVYRHNGNLSWYPLYDNGFCCFSTDSNDNAIERLNKGFYFSRMGSDSEILNDLINFRDIIYPGDLRNIIKYHMISKDLLYKLIDKSDKYNQMCETRRQATIQFICKQCECIHSLNIRRY